MHGILYSLKSFLDIFSILITSLISNKITNILFHRKKVENKELAGGNLINWLKYNPIIEKNDMLIGIIKYHSEKWIKEAIHYRDILTHHGEIVGYEYYKIIMKKEAKVHSKQDIIIPKLPNGEEINKYCNEKINNNLDRFIRDILNLLPNINKSLLKL